MVMVMGAVAVLLHNQRAKILTQPAVHQWTQKTMPAAQLLMLMQHTTTSETHSKTTHSKTRNTNTTNTNNNIKNSHSTKKTSTKRLKTTTKMSTLNGQPQHVQHGNLSFAAWF